MRKEKVIDIKGIEIKPGDTVETKQHCGGVFSPPPGVVGVAEYREYNGVETLMIRYKKPNLSFDSFVALPNQINEIKKA
jgi:hypothetical protein